MKKAKTISFLFLFLLFSFFFKSPAQADSYWNLQIGMEEVGMAYGEDPASVQDIRYRIVKIINIALQLIAIILVILTIFAGFKWMVSGGNEEQIKKAQSILKNAVIGLIIVTASWSITYFILRRLDAINKYNDYHMYTDPLRYN